MTRSTLIFALFLASTATAWAEPYRCNVNGKAVYQETPCNAAAPKGNTAAEIQAEFERERARKKDGERPKAETKANAAADKAVQEKKAKVYALGKQACIAAWKSQLKDPYSAILEGFDGSVDTQDDDQLYAEIRGRAKNSFGAFVPGTWYCGARMEGGNIKITHFSASKY